MRCPVQFDRPAADAGGHHWWPPARRSAAGTGRVLRAANTDEEQRFG